MLTSIRLRNFQSHKDTRVSFSPGLNVVVGTSNAGKTAILRALYWLLYNRPLGLGFIHTGQKEAEVSVVFSDKGETHELSRVRSASINRYVVDGRNLDVVGKDVPEDIVTLLRLDELNIQRQLDLPFLVMSTPGEVAQMFNRYTGLDEAERLCSYVATDVRKLKQTRDSTAAAITQTTQDLQQLDWVGGAEVKLHTLERTHEERQALGEMINDLTNLIKEAKELGGNAIQLGIDAVQQGFRCKQSAELLKSLEVLHAKRATTTQRTGLLQTNLQDLSVLREELRKIPELRQNLNSKLSLLNQLVDLRGRRDVKGHYADRLEDLVRSHGIAASARCVLATRHSTQSAVAEAYREIVPVLDGLHQRRNAVMVAAVRLGNMKGHLAAQTNILGEHERSCETVQQRLSAAKLALAEVTVCPVCQQPLSTPESKAHVLRHYS